MKIIVALIYSLITSAFLYADNCVPHFPLKDGWLGGDAIYSIPISKQKSVWLFGDSFVGNKTITNRNYSNFIANSLAVSHCSNGKWNIEYYWDKKSNHKEFFKAKFLVQEREYKLWPKDGFYYKGKLYIVFDKVGFIPELGIMGFETIGTEIFIIDNPHTTPSKWNYRSYDFLGDKSFSPAVSIVKKDDYIFIFSVLTDDKNHPEHKKRPLILFRLKIDKLINYKNNLEYFSKDDTWKKGVKWKEARIILENGSTEMSVRFHEQLNRWILIMNHPVFFTKHISLWYSKHLEGPWFFKGKIDSFSEMDQENPNYSKDVFCYAAKEHPQFRNNINKSLTVTYACNSLNPEEIMDNNNLYRPIVKTIAIE